MSTADDLSDDFRQTISNEVQRVAGEAARGRGDASTALDFLRDSPGRIGLNSKVANIQTEIGFAREREQERWQHIDATLSRIERNQGDMRNQMAASDNRRMHPAAVWFALLCAFAMAMSSVAVAGATLWWVFGKEVREEYAAVMGCEHP